MFYVATREHDGSSVWTFNEGTLHLDKALIDYAQAVRLYGKLRVDIFVDMGINTVVTAELVRPEVWGCNKDGKRVWEDEPEKE